MNVRVSRIPLQRISRALPKPLRRIRIAQLLAFFTGTPYHRIAFQRGELIGNVRDSWVAHTLVLGIVADYGYFELADHLLVAGDVHVDLGANYGFYAFGLLQSPISPTIRHVLIDANPDCIECLRESAKLHRASRIQVLHAAAAATAGDVTFTFEPASTGMGRVGKAGDSGGIEITVPGLPLDELFEKNGIERIGLLKMDVEGSEPFAMRSLSRMLSAHRVNFIYFEVNPSCMGLLHTDPLELFEEFTRHGYRLFWPHEDVDWIQRTYGTGESLVPALQRFTVWGGAPHHVIGFDQTRYSKEHFGQCDLLAVSPACRIEERGAGG